MIPVAAGIIGPAVWPASAVGSPVKADAAAAGRKRERGWRLIGEGRKRHRARRNGGREVRATTKEQTQTQFLA